MIRTEQDGQILVVTIDRPDAMNALDPACNQALEEVWSMFEANDALSVAILTGAGERAFSAGADLKSLVPTFRETVLKGRKDVVWAFGGGLARGRNFTKPLIAAINGHALAGGMEMALACDIRLCSPNATFSLAEVKWAIIPGAGGTQRIMRAVPSSHALQMLYTGDAIDAKQAEQIGLVSSIVPLPELLPTARSMARRIASRGPLAVRAIKHLAHYGANHSFDDAMVREHEVFLDVMRSEDAREGAAAFREKRTPIYQGR